MRRLSTALSILAMFLGLSGATCPRPPPGVPYPYSGTDSTPPALRLQTMDLVGSNGAQAVNRVPGQATPISAGILDFSHQSPIGPPATPGGNATMEPDQRSLVVSASGTDAESGIRKLRLIGQYRACDANGVLVDYKGAYTYHEEDYAPAGTTSLSANRGFTVTVPLYPLMHPLKDPSDPTKGRKDGVNGSFSFQVEGYNGASQLPEWTQSIVYGVGTMACP